MKKNMLRIVSTLAALTTLCSGSALCASAAETDAPVLPDRIMGDINGDCRVNLYDCLAAAEYYSYSLLGLNGEDVDDTVYPADIDMDGKITLSDLLAMNEHYALEMLGIHPLWADLREVSYADGSEHWGFSTEDGTYKPFPTHFSLTGMYLEVGCAFGKPGEEVTVPVYVAGASGLSSLQYRQSIPEGYDVTDYVVPLVKENDIILAGPSEGQAGIAWIHSPVEALNADISDGMVIAYFTYKIPEDAQPGDINIIKPDISYNIFNTKVIKSDGRMLPEANQYTAVSGAIAVE